MMTLRWGEDEDVLAMGMSSGATGFDHESFQEGQKKASKKQGKREIKASKRTADAAKSGREAETLGHAVNLVKAVGQSALTVGMASAGGPGARSEALADKSAALDVKRQAALDVGDTAKAARLGERSIKLGGKSAKLGLEADYGGSGKR